MELNNQKGFTLIELMITLAIGSMITLAAYATFFSQQRTYVAQDQVAEVQQNLRAAFLRIVIELRMAGYDPTSSGNFTVTSALPGRIQFTADTSGDGNIDSNETIVLGLSPTVDANGDGIPDANSAVNIGGGSGGFQAIAENIQAVEFLYLDSNDAVTTTLSDIRSVQISILAISSREDERIVNKTQYQLPSPSVQTWGPYNDCYKRRLQTLRVRCRNLGL
ncbi:prepilin-type N-terminal cleavage/methylation domain-containing protein [uncultured Desulfobacter sp.]|uniref:prepilin-type N-terminal cleavage/methylation domain-containing protein n=1 Tax=uncultured Desulfobacter sp. TaxID=240139 RepID=UPI002AAAC1A0|nr:prepilin-type N-terminal cleavage/methylation domain-containing protein [uncultured Desulfobacter sp.]